jgi:pyridoxal phosphate enzyme (YggS family)
MSTIAANWQRVRAAIEAASARANRDPEEVRVIAATKTKSADVVREAIASGLRDFGENYVQEAAGKIAAVGAGVHWHMIGHLQRNKAARAVELFDIIQTLDSVGLGRTLSRLGAERGRAVRVLLEVNLGGEASKAGIQAEQAPGLLAALAGEEYLSIEGLMTVPPPGPPDVARSFFRELRCLRDRLQQAAPANARLRELSMGMTDDFEVAIEEGATMVRIGRALLGERSSFGE